MTQARSNSVHEQVRAGYTAVVERASRCCTGAQSVAEQVARRVGYSEDELHAGARR